MSDHREDEFDLGLDFDYVPKEKREQPKDGPPPKTVYERERDAKIAQLKAEHQKQQPQVIKNNVEKGERFTSAPSPPLADGRSYPRSSHSRPYHTSQPQPPPTHMPNGMPDGGVPPPSDSVSAQHGQARDDRGGGSGRSWRRGDWNQRGSGGERSDPNRPPPDPRFLTFRQNKFKMRNALREVDVATMQPAELTIATSSNPDGTGGATSRYYQPPPPTHHNHARYRRGGEGRDQNSYQRGGGGGNFRGGGVGRGGREGYASSYQSGRGGYGGWEAGSRGFRQDFAGGQSWQKRPREE